jgi:predicted DNA binding CopG/RHH family protein
MVRVNLFVQPNVLSAFKALAKRRGTTYSQLMREALRSYAVDQARKEKTAEMET